jgi:DNA-binding NtrC family response regulator
LSQTRDRRKSKQLVLVVDPDTNHARTLERILRREGYRVLSLRTAASALEVMGVQAVRAVLCEVALPDASAEEFLGFALATNPQTRVIFTCGQFDARRRHRLIERGAVECASLPLDFVRLKALLQQASPAALEGGESL